MFERGTGTADWSHRGFFATSGDARQVWARDATTGRVRFLEPGGVTHTVRAACDAGLLVCPMTGCPDPRFIARGGRERRHHFAHRHAETKHASIEVFLREATEMIAQWIGGFRGMELEIAVSRATSDLTIRSTRSGKELHLTLTYDRSYDAGSSGLSCAGRQLLLGHTRGLLLPRRPHEAIEGGWWCASPRLLSTIISQTGYALAINPQERLVGTIVDATVAGRLGVIPSDRIVAENICFVEPAQCCTLTENGIATPVLERFLAAHHSEEQRRTRSHNTRVSSHLPGGPRAKPPDPRQQEYMRRAAGKSTEERLDLLREMFLPDPASDGVPNS